MTPASFDQATARAYIGDDYARLLESRARADAEKGSYAQPAPMLPDTYANKLFNSMCAVVYAEQYAKRRARLERKAAK